MFRDFSLRAVIQRMNVPELKFASSSEGVRESHEEITKRLRDFNITYDIEESDGAKFSEDRFISCLKTEIERMLNESGVRVDGTGGNGELSFYDYSDKNHTGWLEVVAVRIEDNKLKVWGVLTEELKSERR